MHFFVIRRVNHYSFKFQITFAVDITDVTFFVSLFAGIVPATITLEGSVFLHARGIFPFLGQCVEWITTYHYIYQNE